VISFQINFGIDFNRGKDSGVLGPGSRGICNWYPIDLYCGGVAEIACVTTKFCQISDNGNIGKAVSGDGSLKYKFK
jgi:hypothetical protein